MVLVLAAAMLFAAGSGESSSRSADNVVRIYTNRTESHVAYQLWKNLERLGIDDEKHLEYVPDGTEKYLDYHRNRIFGYKPSPDFDVNNLLMEMLDSLSDGLTTSMTPELIDEKVASMSCKAAVKGNNKLSAQEMDALIGELLSLDNPYHCPHGRPTIIAMTKRELEKKFKRIV